MADLSPAAQTVLDAVLFEVNAERHAPWIAAAALRAAAKELGPRRKLEPGYVFSAPAEQWHHEFRLESERKLLAIATELEG